MSYRALAKDVDGTLIKREWGISLSAIKAIRGLENKGIPVILASARPFPVLNILREYIGCPGAIICENGGLIEYEGDMSMSSATGITGYKSTATKGSIWGCC